MPKLDDVSWHLEAAGEPEATVEARAAVHMGLFVAWAIHRDGWKQVPGPDLPGLVRVRSRQMTGTRFLLDHCDGKLLTQFMTPAVARFAESYYPRKFTEAYGAAIDELGFPEYQVPDTWPVFDAVAPRVDAAFAAASRRPWWRFW